MSTSGTPKKAPAKKAPSAPEHPPFTEMISEAIIENADRTGISRASLKKYIETRWKINFTSALNSQLNRSITSGAQKGTFVLPKGASGKVKLAPKGDENRPVRPASKLTSAATKTTAKTATAKPAAKKTNAAESKVTTKKPAAKPTARTGPKVIKKAKDKEAKETKDSKVPKETTVKAKTAPAKTKKPVTAASTATKKKTSSAKPTVKKTVTGTKRATKPKAATKKTTGAAAKTAGRKAPAKRT